MSTRESTCRRSRSRVVIRSNALNNHVSRMGSRLEPCREQTRQAWTGRAFILCIRLLVGIVKLSVIVRVAISLPHFLRRSSQSRITAQPSLVDFSESIIGAVWCFRSRTIPDACVRSVPRCTTQMTRSNSMRVRGLRWRSRPRGHLACDSFGGESNSDRNHSDRIACILCSAKEAPVAVLHVRWSSELLATMLLGCILTSDKLQPHIAHGLLGVCGHGTMMRCNGVARQDESENRGSAAQQRQRVSFTLYSNNTLSRLSTFA